MSQKVRVFLCHASQDKPAVRNLYQRLKSEPWIDPWLDEENLLPGQDFDVEIYKATRDADAIIICLSKVSVAKEGYVNKEIRRALDIAQEKPEGAIYVIPLRLDDCTPSFAELKRLHWANYFTPNAHERLLKSLRARAYALNIQPHDSNLDVQQEFSIDENFDIYRFIQIPETKKVNYSFWIGKYPVTNVQYERFLETADFANPIYWLEFPAFDTSGQQIGDWSEAGLHWLQQQGKNSREISPRYWNDKTFGKSNSNHPVVGISWFEACAYCEWLFQNWFHLLESKANLGVEPRTIRLPLEKEWITMSGGEKPFGRYPWDEEGKVTFSLKEILRRANVKESGVGHTTPVNRYPLGKSHFGVMDIVGNVWEWQANYGITSDKALNSRGGSWDDDSAHVSITRRIALPIIRENTHGFRVALIAAE